MNLRQSDVMDAVRALAACYDDELLRSDHVVDDLFGGDGFDEGRGWLRLAGDITGEYQTVLTPEGRAAIVEMLNAFQAQHDGETVSVVHVPSGRKGSVMLPVGDLAEVRWDGGSSSHVDHAELRTLPDGGRI